MISGKQRLMQWIYLWGLTARTVGESSQYLSAFHCPPFHWWLFLQSSRNFLIGLHRIPGKWALLSVINTRYKRYRPVVGGLLMLYDAPLVLVLWVTGGCSFHAKAMILQSDADLFPILVASWCGALQMAIMTVETAHALGSQPLESRVCLEFGKHDSLCWQPPLLHSHVSWPKLVVRWWWEAALWEWHEISYGLLLYGKSQRRICSRCGTWYGFISIGT